jgi:hypothetical protein
VVLKALDAHQVVHASSDEESEAEDDVPASAEFSSLQLGENV